MAAREIEGNEPIPVNQICCLIYGQPGARKTSLAQSADDPVTLAFDPGIYRAFGRKKAVLFDSWGDVVKYDTGAKKTVVVDTVGMALDKLAVAIIANNPKYGTYTGALTLQGYGQLKGDFAHWTNTIKSKGADLVFIAHEKEDKQGDGTYYRPDITGGSYNTLMNVCDIVGYMHFEQGKKVIDFAPTDQWMAKTPPCGWTRFILPDFGQEPNFLGKLIAEAKASMGLVSKAAAEVTTAVGMWHQWLETDPNLEAFNTNLPELSDLEGPAKAQAKGLVVKHAKAKGWTFDKAINKYVAQKETVHAG